MKVLFVDDEIRVLEGLERSLSSLVEDDVDLSFAHGPAEALEALKGTRYDVVVSDMRMPGMDGGALLEHVYREQPEAIRLVLSGHAKSEEVHRSAKYAHQFLCKPSSAEAILALITTSLQMRELLERPMFRRAVARVDTLPTIPSVYHRLAVELEKPDASVKGIANIVEKDPALVAKLLQLVNSAFFGNGRKVGTAIDAVSRLGFSLIKGLTLAGIFDSRPAIRTPSVDLEKILARSLDVATLARSLAGKTAELAFTGALLQDCGVLVLAATVPHELERVWAEAKAQKVANHVHEQATWGADHTQIGAYLLTLWGLPASLVDIVTRHHASPRESGWTVEAAAVRVAADLVDGVKPDAQLVELVGGPGRLAALPVRVAA